MITLEREKKEIKWTVRDIVYIIVFTLICTGLIQKAQHNVEPLIVQASAAPVVETKTIEVVAKDPRIEKLRAYLVEQNSPLADSAETIIIESDKNAIGWTLMVGIAKMESNLGKDTNQQSHNPFGLLTKNSEGKRVLMQFASWDKAIEYEASLLNRNYRENMNRAIQQKYCPSEECNPDWVPTVSKVSYELTANIK